MKALKILGFIALTLFIGYLLYLLFILWVLQSWLMWPVTIGIAGCFYGLFMIANSIENPQINCDWPDDWSDDGDEDD